MSISSPFIKRPVGTSLLTLGVAARGHPCVSISAGCAVATSGVSRNLSVGASLPGASPETMASAVATPLERQFGRIAGINRDDVDEPDLGSTGITLQFDLNRNIDAAGRDVQAAINAARSQLPSYLPGNPTYRKVNPADAPVLILALTSDTIDFAADVRCGRFRPRAKACAGRGRRTGVCRRSRTPAVRVEVNPNLLNKLGIGLDAVRTALGAANANRPKGEVANAVNDLGNHQQRPTQSGSKYSPLIVAYNNGAPVRLGDATVKDSVEDTRVIGLAAQMPRS